MLIFDSEALAAVPLIAKTGGAGSFLSLVEGDPRSTILLNCACVISRHRGVWE